MHSLFTKTVNVDDAMDDIVRQFKGVSDGLIGKVAGSPLYTIEPASSVTSRNLSWNADDISRLAIRPSTSESINSFSDNDEAGKDVNQVEQDTEAAAQANGWHSDHESKSKGFQQKVFQCDEDASNLDEEIHSARLDSELNTVTRYPESNQAMSSVPQEDITGVPPEVL